MDVDCLRYTRYRMMTTLLQGKAPGSEASIFKVFQAELCQRLHDLALDTMGPDAAAWYDTRLSPEGYEMPMAMTMTPVQCLDLLKVPASNGDEDTYSGRF